MTLACAPLFTIIPLPPISTLFPYTTLFRSGLAEKELPFVKDPARRRVRLPERRRTLIRRNRFGHLLVRKQQIAEQRRSEEHTSELQSPCNLVCRLLLEKKKIHNRRDGASWI